MRYSLNENNQRIEATTKGQKAKCPTCDSIVISKCGDFKSNHWAHKATTDCDSWYEPITDWHLSWQNLFPEEYREVSLKKDNISHRADIMLKNGMVIEIQNSPIKINDIKARESFYGDKNMIWIINGENLLKQSTISYKRINKEFSLTFSIPHYIHGFGEFDNRYNVVYDKDEFKKVLFETEFMKQLQKDESVTDFKQSNGNTFHYEFNSNKNFQLIKEHLYDLFDYVCKKSGIDINVRYPRNQYIIPAYNWDFDVHFVSIPHDKYVSIFLGKRYWSKFIDLMKYPVFIDKLAGLDEDLLYWYQENKILKKEDFINKYLKYI